MLDQRVTYRELTWLLAPMMTEHAAHEFFDFDPGACDVGFNAYDYMVLTVRALETAYQRIPAGIHRDGTSRIRIVGPDVGPSVTLSLRRWGTGSVSRCPCIHR